MPAGVPDFKSDLRDLSEYLIAQLGKLGVNVELNKEANADMIGAFKAEHVILATGSEPAKLDVPGKDSSIVVSVLDLLLAKKDAGHRVIVIGGGYMGCETAIWLAQQGKEVVLVEALEEVMRKEFLANRNFILALMVKHAVEVRTGTKILEVTNSGVLLEGDRGRESVEADTVTFATGPRSVDDLVRIMKEDPSCHAVGDCVLPRKVMGAIWDGFRLARLI